MTNFEDAVIQLKCRLNRYDRITNKWLNRKHSYVVKSLESLKPISTDKETILSYSLAEVSTSTIGTIRIFAN